MNAAHDLATCALADGRYQLDAFLLVVEALEAGDGCACAACLSATELVEACLARACTRFGLLAPLVLRRWGLVCADDIGRVVHRLVAHGLLAAGADDRAADFQHGPCIASRCRALVKAQLHA